jgi:hypothetical protein
MARLLSGARKYKLALVLSHQELRQLTDKDVESALLANAHTRISFRVGDSDAKTLAEGYSSFTADDLKNLQTGEAIAKIGRSQDDFNLQTAMLEDPNPQQAEQTKAAIIELTHSKYATPRNVVEEQLRRSKERSEKPMQQPVTKQKEVVEERKAPAPEILEKESQPEIVQQVPPPAVRKPRAMGMVMMRGKK